MIWWTILIPIVLTAVIGFWAIWSCKDSGYGMFTDISDLFYYGFATIITLVMWIVYLIIMHIFMA